jgi:hypothetical protein
MVAPQPLSFEFRRSRGSPLPKIEANPKPYSDSDSVTEAEDEIPIPPPLGPQFSDSESVTESEDEDVQVLPFPPGRRDSSCPRSSPEGFVGGQAEYYERYGYPEGYYPEHYGTGFSDSDAAVDGSDHLSTPSDDAAQAVVPFAPAHLKLVSHLS